MLHRMDMRRAAPLVLLSCLIGLVAGCPRQTGFNADLEQSSALPQVVREEVWPRTFTDALDHQVTLNEPPGRIISIAPGITETIFAIGEQERLVGVSDFCDYPPQAAAKEKVGNMSGPSLEKVLSLQPDLVFVVRGVGMETVDSLRDAGITVVAEDPQHLQQVIEMVREIGRVLGAEQPADRLAAEMTSRRDEVERQTRARVGQAARPGVLLVISMEPVFVAGPGSFVHDLIHLAGGQNVVGQGEEEVSRPWPQYSLEKIVELDPDLIVMAMGGHTEAEGDLVEQLKRKPGWRDLAAVRERRVYDIEPDILLRVGPRLLDGLETLADIVRGGEGRDAERAGRTSPPRQGHGGQVSPDSAEHGRSDGRVGLEARPTSAGGGAE